MPTISSRNNEIAYLHIWSFYAEISLVMPCMAQYHHRKMLDVNQRTKTCQMAFVSRDAKCRSQCAKYYQCGRLITLFLRDDDHRRFSPMSCIFSDIICLDSMLADIIANVNHEIKHSTWLKTHDWCIDIVALTSYDWRHAPDEDDAALFWMSRHLT